MNGTGAFVFGVVLGLLLPWWAALIAILVVIIATS